MHSPSALSFLPLAHMFKVYEMDRRDFASWGGEMRTCPAASSRCLLIKFHEEAANYVQMMSPKSSFGDSDSNIRANEILHRSQETGGEVNTDVYKTSRLDHSKEAYGMAVKSEPAFRYHQNITLTHGHVR